MIDSHDAKQQLESTLRRPNSMHRTNALVVEDNDENVAENNGNESSRCCGNG